MAVELRRLIPGRAAGFTLGAERATSFTFGHDGLPTNRLIGRFVRVAVED
jgi:hypothetical protein